ncbi:replication protein [Virgibacillus salexigens]|uniref:replication protein n=1 Tax=Virgibacillus massiliensis TaxID=1462526 RepID=UPI001367F74C|nr:replication protein [Virgibacillus massiliensis]MYL44005.1 replication protein RepB [Virgibacillus massiliensis]
MAKDKARYFTFILYPESIPEDWEMRLESIGLPIAISPLHDKDLSGVEGQKYKKAHYHIIYVAKNPVTADSVRLKIKRTLGEQSVSKVQIVIQSMENIYLYLTHESKDAIAKNKHKYDKKDIKLLNNFDIDRYITLDVEDKDDMLNDVCDLIDEHGLANIRELRRFVKSRGTEHGLPSMKIINSVLRSHTGLIRLYFDAVYQERKYGRSDIDRETGEIKYIDTEDTRD